MTSSNAVNVSRAWWRDHRDLSAPLALEGLILSGRQPVTLALIGAVTSLAVVGTDTEKIDGVRAYASPKNGKNLGKTAMVAGVKYVF